MSEQKTVSIFVDVQNVYYTSRQTYKRNFDYNKFWSLVTKNRKVINAIAYATYRNDQKQTEFQNILRAIGFSVKLKPYITRMDGTAKADWDVGIAIDIMEMAETSDIIVATSLTFDKSARTEHAAPPFERIRETRDSASSDDELW